MNTSCEKVILGFFVLDKIITSKSENSHSINTENDVLSLGGPPTFMLYFSDLLRHLIPVMKPSNLFSFVSRRAKHLLDDLSILDQNKSQLIQCHENPKFVLDYSQPTIERKLTLFDPPGEFKYNLFNWEFNNPPIVIVSSVYQEFNSSNIFSFLREKECFIAFDPQGCFREISTTGEISYTEWFSHDILSQLDCIKLADNEMKLLGLGTVDIDIIMELLSLSPKYVIITKGENGSLLGIKNQKSKENAIFSVPAYPVEDVINETGAGDGFLYSFISFLQLLGDELEAIAYATSLASLLLEYGFEKEKYNLHEIKYRKKVIHSEIKKIYPD
ncbi:MAG: PfkB family carbohydrate kinase [Candidatus Hodarchaeales archaeon]|jgi:hypothetical protein